MNLLVTVTTTDGLEDRQVAGSLEIDQEVVAIYGPLTPRGMVGSVWRLEAIDQVFVEVQHEDPK